MPLLDAMQKLVESRAGRSLDPLEARKVAEKLISLMMRAPRLVRALDRHLAEAAEFIECLRVSSTGYAKILRSSIGYFSKAETDLKTLISVGELVGYDMSEEKELLEHIAEMRADLEYVLTAVERLTCKEA